MGAITTTLVQVKYSSGAYTTQTVMGQRASSTTSAEAAITGLARKLNGVPDGCTFERDVAAGIELWRMPIPRTGS